MDTQDLTSYYPGYDDYEEIGDDDARREELEEKIRRCESAIDELEDVIEDDEQYGPLDKIKFFKAILYDLKEELEYD